MPDIRWLGHSCFALRSQSKVTLITDPYDPSIGYKLGKPTADIVTLSHDHRDHAYADGVKGDPYVIRGPGEYEVKGIFVTGIATYHDDAGGKKRGRNTVYLITMDDVTICHLGDLGHPLTQEQSDELSDVDVLLIPVGGTYTIDAAQAAELVRQVEPGIVIPMHYKTPDLNFPLAPVDAFLGEMGIKKLESQPKLTVRRGEVPEETQVVVLDYHS